MLDMHLVKCSLMHGKNHNSMNRYLTFDLEIWRVLPDDIDNWASQPDLGISCQAVMSDDFYLQFDGRYNENGRLTRESCRQFVRILLHFVRKGYTLVTFNVLAFDFRILAEESGMYSECAALAWKHVDIMFLVVALKGHWVGLDTACKGMGIKGKQSEVYLNDGTLITNMQGSLAPKLWQSNEYTAVSQYLAEDVRSLLDLTHALKRKGTLEWVSRANKLQTLTVSLDRVSKAWTYDTPDNSWMTNPPNRNSMVKWMKKRHGSNI